MKTLIGFIVAIMLGLFFGDHLNSAVFFYLKNYYDFNETVAALVGVLINLLAIAFFCYLWYWISPKNTKI